MAAVHGPHLREAPGEGARDAAGPRPVARLRRARAGHPGRMLQLLLDLVQRERNNEIVDRALLRSVTTVRAAPT